METLLHKTKSTGTGKIFTLSFIVISFLLWNANAYGVTKTSSGTGNWSASGTWSPSGVPASTDDVIIASNSTVTIDGNYTCNNLDIGTTANSSATLQIISSGKSLTINGAFSLNPNNKSKVFTLDAGPGTINVSGSLNWGTSGNIYIKVGTGTVSFTQAVTISASNQEIVFTDAGTINFNSSFTDSKNHLTTFTGCTVNFGGSYTVNTTSANWNGKGTAVFTGSTAAQITGALPVTFNNLTINNSAGVTLNLSPAAATVVTGALAINNGTINTTSTNILKLSSTATSTSGSASSYVNGPMIKAGNTSFTFPVGKSGKWRRVGISGMTNATTQVTAEYFASAYSDISTLSGSLTHVSPVEYWMVDRTITSDPVKLRFYWENANASAINNCSYLTVAHYKNSRWQEEPATTVEGSTCSGSGNGSIEMSSTVTSFSPFSFGDNGNALPVKLVSFKAEARGNIVQTNWVTELEVNNAYFTVERSTDGINFTEVAHVDGAGNSTSLLSYESYDNHPLRGISYYRLRQTDFDGQFSYSDIEVVGMQQDVKVAIYPNPTDNEVFVNVANPSDQIQLAIYDLSGRKVYERFISVDLKTENYKATIQAKYLLPPGVYIISASTNGVEQRERMVLD